MKAFICLWALMVILLGRCSAGTASLDETLPFGKAINIGNALEAPRDIPWDVTLKDEYFTIIKKAGFDCVRLPVRFSDYVEEPDYRLNEDFMKKLDEHIRYALKVNLYIILDFHHFNELMKEPEKYHDAFLAVWRQLSKRYQGYPNKLIFEVLNEPNDRLTGELWNVYLAEAVDIIRKDNPQRYVVVGGDGFSSVDSLARLRLPDTERLILTFHYYEPPEFTFQEHEYLGYEEYKNVKWNGTAEERQYLKNRFALVRQWAENNNVPVLVGEFGVNEKVPKEMRVAWTTAVRKEAEKNGFAWAYWEFGSVFGAYDLKNNSWKRFIVDALMK